MVGVVATSDDALQSALSGYLSTLAAIADCVGEACPEVGAPYRQRLHRLRNRLAFQMTPDAVEESASAVEGSQGVTKLIQVHATATTRVAVVFAVP